MTEEVVHGRVDARVRSDQGYQAQVAQHRDQIDAQKHHEAGGLKL